MRKFSRNIALVFCLIFLFPVVWQSVHQVSHALNHHCQACPDDLHFSLLEEECAICAYEFAKFEESSNSTWLPQLSFLSFRFQPEITVCPEYFHGFHFCLRAPPVS
jgi:hypothetical protein